MNKMVVTNILSVTKETPTIKTIEFVHEESIIPGQFYMIWIPGVDEIPMSVSKIQGKNKSITFKDVGPASHALFQKKPDELIGIRGPFGTSFSIKGHNILLVGGGTGTAMIAPAAEQALQQKKTVTVVMGAKTKDELFFEQRLKQTNATVFVTTDDGSYGIKAKVTEKVAELLSTQTFDYIGTCGPEAMMKHLLHISKKIPLQASLERYMKCAIGLCGQCCVGKGLRVCVEGPIFDRDVLEKLPDFGVFTRDASGRKIMI